MAATWAMPGWHGALVALADRQPLSIWGRDGLAGNGGWEFWISEPGISHCAMLIKLDRGGDMLLKKRKEKKEGKWTTSMQEENVAIFAFFVVMPYARS